MRLIFIIIILSSINLIAGNGLSFKIDIESSGIPYMPIKAVLEVRNDTGMDIKIPDTKGNLYELIDNKYTKERIKFFKFEVNGKIDSSCFSNEKGKYILKEQKYKTLKAGEKEIYKCSNIEGFLGIIDEGIYYLRGIWDSSEGKGYKCRWESEWIKIELRAEGEDRTLIEELKKNYPNGYKCMLIDLAYNKNLGEYVLEKYPTSTYAGWVLVGNYQDYIKRTMCLSKEEAEAIMKERAKLPKAQTNDKARQNLMERVAEEQRKYREKRIPQLDLFVNSSNEFFLKDLLRYELAGWYRHRGDIDKAIKEYKWIVENSKDEKVKECARQMLEDINNKEKK